MEIKRIKYCQKPPLFYADLRARIAQYFTENGKTKYADTRMHITGDLVGVSSYVMDFNHVRAHHSAVNIPMHDVAIDDYTVPRGPAFLAFFGLFW